MIDTKEIRKALAIHGVDVLNEDEVLDVLDHLEAAEKEIESWKGVAKQLGNDADTLRTHLSFAKDELNRLRARIKEMERQEPGAWCATDETGTVVEALSMNQSRRFDTPLYLAPGAQPAPSVPDTHNDMVVGFDYQGAMSCARQRAKKEAGLLCPEGDARKEEKERELASEYYRQDTTPNPEAKP